MTHGYVALMGQDENRAPGSAILGTKTILCQIGTYWYHCAGLPFQLYLIVFIAALVLLFLYIASCAFVLAWMYFPSFGSLSNVMENFETKFKKLNQDPNSHHELQWGLYSVYYNNKDTKLLLDLLASSSGIAPCLKLLCLFDKNLKQNVKVRNLSATLQDPDSDGYRDVVVKFENPKAVEEIFSHIPKSLCTYAVEISPPVKSVKAFDDLL